MWLNPVEFSESLAQEQVKDNLVNYECATNGSGAVPAGLLMIIVAPLWRLVGVVLLMHDRQWKFCHIGGIIILFCVLYHWSLVWMINEHCIWCATSHDINEEHDDDAFRECLLRPPPMTPQWLPLALVALPPHLHLDRCDKNVWPTSQKQFPTYSSLGLICSPKNLERSVCPSKFFS